MTSLNKRPWEELFERMNPKRFDHPKRFLDSHYDSPLQYVKEGWTLLDVGCATANLYKYTKKRNIKYTGLDFSKHLLDGARERHPDAKLIEASVLDLPFSESHFNVSYAKSVLEHLHPEDVKQAVIELVRVAKDKVILVFHRYPDERLKENTVKKRRGYFEIQFSHDWLLDQFKNTGRFESLINYRHRGRGYWIVMLN